MRLTCPNCGAAYETPAGLIPGAGSHVQCSACHTRWYAREAGADRPTEDEIVTRLETRASRPALQPLPPLPAQRRTVSVAPFPGTPFEATPLADQTPQSASETPLRPSPAARESPAAEPAAAPAPAARAAAPQRDGFATGFLLVAATTAAALGLYLRAGDVAAALPQAGPAIEAYAAWVDGAREAVEDRLGPMRDRIAVSAGGA